MMTSVSVVAMCALAPGLAVAQDTLVGGSGQALTAGVISVAAGDIIDNGTGRNVRIVDSPSGVIVDGATINHTFPDGQSGLMIDGMSTVGLLDVVLDGASTITAQNNGFEVYTGAADILVDLSSGGHSIRSATGFGGTALSVYSVSGDVTIQNGANTIQAERTAVFARSLGDDATITFNSVGGTINGLVFILADETGLGGDIVLGEGDGITTALTSSNNGYYTSTSGDGTIDIRTGLGGTVNAAGVGIWGNSAGNGDISIITGDAITATDRGVYISSGGGNALVDVGGEINSTGSAIFVDTAGDADVTILTRAAVSSYETTVVAYSDTGQIDIGTSDLRLGDVTSSFDRTGVFAATAGDISIYASDVTAGRGIVGAVQAAQGVSVDGSLLIDVSGSIVADRTFGIVAVNNSLSAERTTTVRTKDVTSTGGSAISAQSVGGDINIVADGAIVANSAANGTWDGIFAEVSADANISILATGPVTGSFVGIDALTDAATTQGAITITALEDVQGQTGIRALSTGDGAITIDAGDVSGIYGAGVFARGAADVSISTGSVTSLDGLATTATDNVANVTDATFQSGFGVVGLSSGGSVSINTTGLITGGPAGGVLAQVTGGLGDVNITTAAVTAEIGRGIEADALGGDIVINATGDIVSQGNGIDASNTAGGVITVTASGPIDSAAGNGVAARNTGAGATRIGTADQRLAGPVSAGQTGLFATSSGDVSIFASAVNGATRGVVASSQGENPNGQVVIDLAGPIVGQSSFGVIGRNNGVLAENTLSITSTGSVTSTNGSAISAQTVNGDITINAASVTANAGPNNATWDGVFAEAQGDALIDITTTGTVFGTFNGIEALTGGDGTRGGITISALGDVEGDSTFGVRAVSTGGDITVSAGGTVSGAQGGVNAVVTGAGSIALEAAGLITTAGVGLSATTVGGDIAITTLAGGDIAPGSQIGILAQTQTGAIVINQAGDIGAIDEGMTVPLGVYATVASGDAGVTIVSTGGIFVTPGEGLESAGIYVAHGGTGAINVTTSGIIDPGAYGVVLQGGGDVTYTADGGLVEGDVGVLLASTGDGNVSFTSTAGTEVIGLNGAAVQAQTGDGNLTLVLDGTTTGASTGVVAVSTGGGATSLTSNGDVFGLAGPGIDMASGTGGLSLTVDGIVASASGSAINATSTGGATINVGEDAFVTGQIDTPDTAVINLTTASGFTSTINVAEGGVVAAADGSAFNVAIRAEGGSVVVNNAGTIAGTVDFSALTGENSGELVNGPDTVFLTGGTSVFSAGNDDFNNGGILATLGERTVFDFRGGTNIFSNSGVIQVGFNPVRTAGSSFVLLNVDAFNNSGTLEMANGVAGDSIVAEGADFIGSGASLLSIDTEVGQPGGRSDTLVVGQASGVTGIRINDVSSTFSGLDTAGILLVSGDTSDGDFVLDAGSSSYSSEFGGVIDRAGLFMGQLATDARGTVLITAPKTEAYQFTTLGMQAQSVWRATAGSGERQAQRRDLMANSSGQSVAGMNVWADIQGLAAQRDVNPSYGQTNHQAGYDQDIVTATFGLDAVQAGQGGLVSYGASLGYVTSDTQFDARRTQVDMTGAAFTAHIGYLSPSGLFGAGSVVANVLEAEVEAPELNGFDQQDVDITTLGGLVEVGIRRAFAFGSVIEPSVSLTYSETHLDTLSTTGSTIRFEDSDSLRAAAGVRMSGDVGSMSRAWRTRYTLGGSVVNEFSAENSAQILNSGSPLTVVDTLDGVFGELRAGVSSQSVGGWTVFGEGSTRFNSDSSEVGLTAGIRLRY